MNLEEVCHCTSNQLQGWLRYFDDTLSIRLCAFWEEDDWSVLDVLCISELPEAAVELI